MTWIGTGWAKKTFGGTVWFLPETIESAPQCPHSPASRVIQNWNFDQWFS